ncbi:MAG: C4-type zinc ribbon domain-containing protein [Bacteroidales bacterium]|nr:C4-type zinc ribbon domain-containing protein [Bacteroidales bacterium]MDD2425354.1 C4-type zinc ribbon domain-containing protein [Bacteroidales bacterium]MDD3989234.1 C4-type zinc ribbon domain-containing protein [Bacteroidales bacterium]MDD4638407.1 C4-type zinc ribbon domain-containing protein [Bacteroidales bacterium]
MATAKTKSTIEPPLDGGTFISLQKSGSESDLSMETKLHLLYQLQLTDSKIDQIHLLRGELPLEVQDLEDDIQGLKTRLENLQTEQKDIEKSIAQKKIDLENAKLLIEKYTSQQNNVKNNREYDSLSKEIEYQELEVQHSDKLIREKGLMLAEKKEAIIKASEDVKERAIDLEIKKKELESIVSETAIEEEDLLKKSEEISSQIDARMLAAYKKVRQNARNGLAVVTVRRDACAGCFNKIPPQRQLDISSNKKIIVCEYCGRILVSAEFEK